MNRVSKMAAIFLLVVGVFLGVFAIFSSLNKKNEDVMVESRPVAQGNEVNVVVASYDLPAGHNLRLEDLEIKKTLQLGPNNFSDPSNLVGRTTAVEIAAQAPLLKSNVLEGISGFLAEGERAVAIKVDEASSVGHKIKPGDWVDLFVVLRRDGQEVDATQARMLLSRKRVIAYGAKSQSDGPEGDAKNNDTQSAVARTAVLAVQVQEVNRLLLAEQHGQVQLALRSPLDHNEPSADILDKIPGLNLSSNLNQNVNSATHSIDSSLMALKMSELGSDAVKTAAFSNRMRERGIRFKNQKTTTGIPVEIIRGGKKEVIHY